MNDRSRPQRFRAWGRRQLSSFFSSLGSLANNAVGTLMTVAVLGIANTLALSIVERVRELADGAPPEGPLSEEVYYLRGVARSHEFPLRLHDPLQDPPGLLLVTVEIDGFGIRADHRPADRRSRDR